MGLEQGPWQFFRPLIWELTRVLYSGNRDFEYLHQIQIIGHSTWTL